MIRRSFASELPASGLSGEALARIGIDAQDCAVQRGRVRWRWRWIRVERSAKIRTAERAAFRRRGASAARRPRRAGRRRG
jgi:hypothetical protein